MQRNFLARLYNTDSTIRSQIRLLFALAYIPPDYVQRAFQLLKAALDSRLESFLKYFKRNYVGIQHVRTFSEPLFSHVFWNLYQRTLWRIPRTNNAVESWHNSRKNVIGAPHPPLNQFMIKLRQMQHLGQLRRPTLRDERFIAAENNLRTIVLSFNQAYILEYLSAVANSLEVLREFH